MKNFVKLIEQVHAQRYMKVLNAVVAKKIPVAFMSIDLLDKAVDTVKNFRAQGLNVTQLITTFEPRNEVDFDVVNLRDAEKIYPQPEYIFTNDPYEIDARIALKNFPDAKIIIMRDDTDAVYETFMSHLDELREVYESLIDDMSRKTFRGYWLGNISNRFGEIVYTNAEHYLIDGFIPAEGAVVIDGGLGDGGTAKIFAQTGYQVYGFEPSRQNFEVARKVAAENNFVAENLGLGAYKHETTFTQEPNPGASKIDPHGTETVKITTLDAYVREKNLRRVDFIKLDVEGAELDVLRGAVTTIARFKPILALSAYHKWDDFWTLMNFLKSIRPDYEFAMRQFVMSREDGAYLFDANTEKNLDLLGLRPAITNSGECVLFAR